MSNKRAWVDDDGFAVVNPFRNYRKEAEEAAERAKEEAARNESSEVSEGANQQK